MVYCDLMSIVWYNDYMKKDKKTNYRFSVLIEKDENGYYIGTVPALKSCYTQAKTLSVLYRRLEEVIKLCLDVETKDLKVAPRQNEFIGLQQFEFRI